MKNILNLEMNEMLNKEPNVILEIFPSGEKGSTNLFFIFLDSSGNIPAKPLGSQ
jgi:hypothetical protein